MVAGELGLVAPFWNTGWKHLSRQIYSIWLDTIKHWDLILEMQNLKTQTNTNRMCFPALWTSVYCEHRAECFFSSIHGDNLPSSILFVNGFFFKFAFCINSIYFYYWKQCIVLLFQQAVLPGHIQLPDPEQPPSHTHTGIVFLFTKKLAFVLYLSVQSE